MQADTQKQITIIACIAKDGATAKELAERLGWCNRNVYRYLADLRKTYGMKIELQDGKYHILEWGAFDEVWIAAHSNE